MIVKNQAPDLPFEQSINPYKGCEHGCIYCYARPTHAYLGLSPGLDFETRLFAKTTGPAILEKELRKKRYECKVITLGANTDPYQPIERQYEISRQLLQIMSDFNQPVVIITKSALILRDIDILQKMAERNLARIMVSVTTLDNKLANLLEPRAAAPHRRIETIQQLSEAGIPVSVNAAPMIPILNDHELEAILEASTDAGATTAAYILLRLPMEVSELFREWLQAHFPLKAQHVMSILRQMRGGADYESTSGVRFRGRGPFAQLLKQRYKIACERLGLNKRSFQLDTSQFAPPPQAGDQLSLF